MGGVATFGGKYRPDIYPFILPLARGGDREANGGALRLADSTRRRLLARNSSISGHGGGGAERIQQGSLFHDGATNERGVPPPSLASIPAYSR